jgi:hypothetical protein
MTARAASAAALGAIRDLWSREWPQALELWSRFTKLRDPLWCTTAAEEAREGLGKGIAMIRLADHVVVIGLQQVHELALEKLGSEILAHEIGHHVYCPANLVDHGRMLARARKALKYQEHHTAMVCNLYSDLLINNRLQRQKGLRMAEVYKTMGNQSTDPLWNIYLRIYEILWSLPRQTLCNLELDSRQEVDAQLGARVIRVFAKDWLKGVGRFAAICYPYLCADEGKEVGKILKPLFDTLNPSPGGNVNDIPDGLIDCDPDEAEGAVHPALDEEFSGVSSDAEGGDDTKKTAPQAASGNLPAGGQHREPFEFGEILKGLGFNIPAAELAKRFYRERAIPHLIPFPTKKCPESQEPLLEGLDTWDVGAPFENLDVFESAMRSPVIIPGVTTVERYFGTSPGSLPERQPIDLDLYVDCSGSMPNPQQATSYLTLAGAIISLSALRVGSQVKATLWSGKDDFLTTGKFGRDESAILGILTGYIGGWTAFPIHLLRETFQERTEKDRPVHVLIISDEGVDTLFNPDEKGNSGWNIARMALSKARGGGTMVLNLYRPQEQIPVLVRAAKEGWNIFRVTDWAQLVTFAREFSRQQYGEKGNDKRKS